jgi:hypothetical protein
MAIVLTGLALSIDPACQPAAIVVRQLARESPDKVGRDTVVAAELQVARTILQLTTSIHRLSDATKPFNPDVTSALRHADRLLKWLSRCWQDFRDWPFGSAPTDIPGKDAYRAHLGAFVEVALDLTSGKPDAFDRFMKIPAATEVVAHFSSSADSDIAAEIPFRLWRLFYIDGWFPTAATYDDFLKQTKQALDQRIRVSSQGGLEFRGDLFEGEDGDGGEVVGDEGIGDGDGVEGRHSGIRKQRARSSHRVYSKRESSED